MSLKAEENNNILTVINGKAGSGRDSRERSVEIDDIMMKVVDIDFKKGYLPVEMRKNEYMSIFRSSAKDMLLTYRRS